MFENSVHLMGRLTADPELKTFGDGAVVCNFTVAINRPVAKGEHPEADFVRCVAWRQTAELLEKYFDKDYFFIKLSPINKNEVSESNGMGDGVIEGINLV